MNNRVNLDAYMERIGYQGPRTPELPWLAALLRHHVAAIAFESLSPFLGVEVTLSASALENKLIHQRRGGYCYEHNLLFQNVLEQLGFQVRGLGARVLWEQPATARTGVTHMLLLVTVEGVDYLVDAGFGALTPTAPLRMDRVGGQSTPHEPFRILHLDDHFLLQAYAGGAWKRLYQFDLRQMWQADYEIGSWYLSHHPESHFVTNLVACRADEQGRRNLNNGRFSWYRMDGTLERRLLTDPDEVLAVLSGHFALEVTGLPGLRARVEEMLSVPELEAQAKP